MRRLFHILQDLSFKHIELALGCSQRQLNLEQTPFYASQIFLLTFFWGWQPCQTLFGAGMTCMRI